MASITYETCICLLYMRTAKFYCDFSLLWLLHNEKPQ